MLHNLFKLQGIAFIQGYCGSCPQINGVITYACKLYPGSISDKAMAPQSSLLNHFTSGDVFLAHKGFLIQDILPNGVSVNSPPFLNNGTLTESEASTTKEIAKCGICVEKANARLKDLKILRFISSYLWNNAVITFQLCVAPANLEFPLIKEGCEGYEFESLQQELVFASINICINSM